MKEHRVERLPVEHEHVDAARLEWQSILDSASEFMATQKLENTWTVANCKTALKSWRCAKAEKKPKKKNGHAQLPQKQHTMTPANIKEFSVAIDPAA